MPLSKHSLPLDEKFLQRAARLMLDRFYDPANPAQLAKLRVIVPNLLLVPGLSTALANEVGGPLLLPIFDTMSGTLQPWEPAFNPLPEARRQLSLHGLLRRHAWFDESALWDVVSELTALFDQLTEHAQRLPEDEATLAQQLETAFNLRDSAALAFEARVVHTLWRAESQGRPSRTAAKVLAAARWAAQLESPICVLAEGTLDADRAPLLVALLERCAKQVPTLMIVPQRHPESGCVAAVLNHAWPLPGTVLNEQPLIERANLLANVDAAAAMQQLHFVTTDSLESLANAVADQVCRWLNAGKRQIALIASDRLAARRARALLERYGVLVEDETGWKLSTTRAAASIDAWIEMLVSDAYHRTLVDLLKSPFLFADFPDELRATGALQIERMLSRRGIISGLDTIAQTLQETDAQAPALRLIGRLIEARRVMPANGNFTISQWLHRLQQALDILGASATLAADAAGSVWQEWLQTRRNELADDNERFSLTHWRQWFNREMDVTLFRDRAIDSPVVLTHLAATRLRSFDAAIIIGADSERLQPPRQPAWLAHDGVRRELGLPGKDIERARLREDLAGLALCCGETVFAWQQTQRQERLLPGPDLEILIQTLSLRLSRSIVTHAKPIKQAAIVAMPQTMPAPSVPPAHVPQRISASSFRSLLACPYQYFARYILRLAELEEVSEELEKRDFGEQLHALLEAFHTEFPLLSGHSDDALIVALDRYTTEAFAPLVERNFLDHAWRIRWQSHLASYIQWQRSREVDGWRFLASEEVIVKKMPLSDGAALELHGRIDRVDARGEERGLIDYKARKLTVLRKQVIDPDDVQLAFYTLLKNDAVTEAGYVSVDDESIGQVILLEPAAAAETLAERIDHLFVALRSGVGMPANGDWDTACTWCEARGLCRKDWHT